MVSITYTQDTSATAFTQSPPVVDKVNAVAAVQTLPQDGKKLPQDSHKATELDAGTEPVAENIEQAVQAMNEHVQMVKRQLEFSIDDQIGRAHV